MARSTRPEHVAHVIPSIASDSLSSVVAFVRVIRLVGAFMVVSDIVSTLL